MNSISLVKYDKPSWVVQKEKFNRYKLYQIAKKDRKTNSFVGTIKSGFCFDYGDKLRICNLKGRNKPSSWYVLKIKNGRPVIYKISIDAIGLTVKNTSNNIGIFENILTKSGKDRFRKIVFNFFSRNGVKLKKEKNLYSTFIKLRYPSIVNLPLVDGRMIRLGPYKKHLRSGGLKDIVHKCFGYSGNKLTKLIAESGKNLPNYLEFGMAFKGFLKEDEFRTFLGVNVFYSYICDADLKNFRKFLSCYKRERILIMLKHSKDRANTDRYSADAYVLDCGRLYFDTYKRQGFYMLEKPKSFVEIHNHLVKLNNNLPKQADISPLPVSEKMQKIDGQIIEDLRIEVPKITNDLAKYGLALNNCIRSYSYAVKNKATSVLAIYKKDNLAYNLEIRDNKVRQFVGNYNSQPDQKDKELVEALLKENEIIQ